MNYSEDDTFIGVLPFFHIYGQIVVLMTGLKAGSKIVTMPKFDPEQYLKLAQEHKVRLNLLPLSHRHNPQYVERECDRRQEQRQSQTFQA